MRLTVPLLAFAFLAAFPDALWACPVCFDRDDASRMAFIATTGLLTFLPLGLVLGTTVWLRKRAKDLDDGADGD